MTASLTIREAVPSDADAIAALHVEVWRRTYRDLAPPPAYDTLDQAARRRSWNAILGDVRPGAATLVAEKDGRLAGFAHGGAPGNDAFGGRGEVKYLYVATGFARQGIGRILLARLAARLAAFGYRGVALGVVAGNDPALAFYRALGGEVIGRYTDPGPLWRSDNLLCAWDDAQALARQA